MYFFPIKNDFSLLAEGTGLAQLDRSVRAASCCRAEASKEASVAL